MKQYTKAEYDMLLMLRRRPRNWKYVAARLRPRLESPRENMDLMLHDCSDLLKNALGDYWTKKLELNQQGLTVARAEFDRRFDMYCTRVVSIASLVISAIALAVSLLD